MTKPKRHGLHGMPFDEAIARLAQTKPEEVKPPPGKKRKTSKAAKRLASVAARQAPKESLRGDRE
jgi:hypothetical protein